MLSYEELQSRFEAVLEAYRLSLNARVKIENELFAMADGKLPLPDAQKCRELAIRLGTQA